VYPPGRRPSLYDLLRTLRGPEAVAARLRATRALSEATIEELDGAE